MDSQEEAGLPSATQKRMNGLPGRSSLVRNPVVGAGAQSSKVALTTRCWSLSQLSEYGSVQEHETPSLHSAEPRAQKHTLFHPPGPTTLPQGAFPQPT